MAKKYRMRRLFVQFLLVIGFFFFSSFQKDEIIIPPITKVPAFIGGEELKYTLHYGFITAGEAQITLKNEVYGGKEVFHGITEAHTTGVVNKVFKVVDIYESYFDGETNLPVKSIRNIREGNYKKYTEVIFDHSKNIVTSSLTGEHKVPINILDMVSALFYVRRIDFSNYKENDIVKVDTYFDDDLFPFYIVFKGREVVSTDLGKFHCLKFVPVVEPGRIFKKKDDMTFWLSDDANKIPVSIRFDIIVGSFKCDLVSYKNNKYLMSSRISMK